ncbi:hypothetical protein [Streptomyces sp. C]|uniref:hypothetical protein n=1 Tax=Streptomyces sp. C TaxID=253839 RepID=UPI0001B5091C|nr:hypothetical protein [Streptomyces sp. C]
MLLDPSQPPGAQALSVLRGSPLVREVHDRIEDQVAELVRCQAPGESFGPQALDRAVAQVVSGRPDRYGRWA